MEDKIEDVRLGQFGQVQETRSKFFDNMRLETHHFTEKPVEFIPKCAESPTANSP